MTTKELKAWREQNHYTQVELAKVLGVTNICISRWETGERQIPSFLALTLSCLERKGGEHIAAEGIRKKEVKKKVYGRKDSNSKVR